jgi:hypothetical protein
MRTYVLLSAILFDLITALQLVRFLLRWPVTIAGFTVPLWVSAVAAIVAGSLAVWGTRLVLQTRSRAVVA